MAPAVAHERERGAPGALELNVPPHAVAVDQLAEQNRPPVAELRHPSPELVPGIGHRKRRRIGRHPASRQDLDALGRLQHPRVESEVTGEPVIQANELRRRRRCRRQAGEKPVR